MRASIRTGLERLLDDQGVIAELREARVGVLGNPTSVDGEFRHLVDLLVERGVKPVRLFGPEHGLRGEAQDMISVEDDVDAITGIPTVSLYGKTFDSLRPTARHLEGLDVMLVDLQDVGSRYYTYVYTAMMTAEACTEAGVRCVLLDRPNPIGGAIEGPGVLPGYESFVGMLDLPNRHGLTLAEVVEYARQRGRTIDVDVLHVEGWQRDTWFDQHDAPWVLPSPNMPTLDTAIVYPGMCLLEGTNLSEGRGTTRPFELFGAPYIDPVKLRKELDALELPGVRFRLIGFEPTFQKWGRTRCRGLQIHVTDRDSYDSLAVGAAVVWACARLFPDAFAWRAEAYEFVDEIPAIDLLFGSDVPRRLIEDGASFDELTEALSTPDGLAERIAAARLGAYDD